MKVEVWTYKEDCWSCGESMVIWYPKVMGSRLGGTWGTVGEELSKKPQSPIERVYSEIQETEVWGNVCPSCGEYYGNYHVWKDVKNYIMENGEEAIRKSEIPKIDITEKKISICCIMCGKGQLPTTEVRGASTREGFQPERPCSRRLTTTHRFPACCRLPLHA